MRDPSWWHSFKSAWPGPLRTSTVGDQVFVALLVIAVLYFGRTPKDSGRPLKLGHHYGSAESKVGCGGSEMHVIGKGPESRHCG